MLFREDFLVINWLEKLEKQDSNYSFNKFYEEIENLMDKYIPLENINPGLHMAS